MIRKRPLKSFVSRSSAQRKGKRTSSSPPCTRSCNRPIEPGCIRYELNQRVDDPRWITYVEKWKDKQTFDEHCAMPYITHFFNDVQPGLVREVRGEAVPGAAAVTMEPSNQAQGM